MDELAQVLIEAEVAIHRARYACEWRVFSISIAWAKIRRSMSTLEREHFRKCWEGV